MRISEIMQSVFTIGAEEPATAAWQMMRFHHTRHLMVVNEEGRVVGVISASDLGGTHGDPILARSRVRDLMTEKLVPVQAETTVREAANLMRAHALNCLPVFGSNDRLKGIVTVVDLLELLGRVTVHPMVATERPVPKNPARRGRRVTL